MSRRFGLFVGAFVTLFTGGIIYLLWRSESLLMFRWVEAAGMDVMMTRARGTVQQAVVLPEWARMSLPTALWSYSLGACLGAIWFDSTRFLEGIFTVLFVGLGVAEVAQIIVGVPGTYTSLDLGLNSAAILAAMTQSGLFNNERD